MTDPFVSIVIPTRNGTATLPGVLQALKRQRVDVAYEIVAVDSSSSDGTGELLQSVVDRVLSVPAESFDHGLTRNYAISQTRGDLVVLLSQDAEPASDDWLMKLIAPLRADLSVAGSFARQQARADADVFARYYHDRSWSASPASRTMALRDAAELTSLDPIDRYHRCAFDNVCSCVRRSVWTRIPFRRAVIGEDIEWGKEALLAGHRLVYVADAPVLHSHTRSARYELTRTYFVHQRLYRLFGLTTIPTASALVRSIVSSLRIHARCLRKSGEARPAGNAARAIALAFAWPVGQYAGALSARRGWNLLDTRRVRCES